MAKSKTKGIGPDARGRSPSPLQPPKALYRIYMTVEHNSDEIQEDQVDTYILEIPRDVVEGLTQVDHTRLILHDHGPRNKYGSFVSNPPLLQLLASSNNLQDTRNVVIGNTLYHFLRNSSDQPQIHSLDISQAGAQWTAIPPPPHSEYRYFPSLGVLRGRLYLMGGIQDACKIDGVTFGEEFDPETQSWADLKPLPRESLMNVCPFFLTSLGDEEGKILLINTIKHYMDTQHYKKTGGKYNHVAYNLATTSWEDFRDPELSLGFHLSGCVASVEREKTIYWLDIDGLFNSYDWERKELSSGPVVGFDHEIVLDDLEDQHNNFSLLHIWSDYFCLVWSCPTWDGSQRTNLHTTFLRVVKDSVDPSLLFTHVVGCFVNWIDGNRRFRGGVIV